MANTSTAAYYNYTKYSYGSDLNSEVFNDTTSAAVAGTQFPDADSLGFSSIHSSTSKSSLLDDTSISWNSTVTTMTTTTSSWWPTSEAGTTTSENATIYNDLHFITSSTSLSGHIADDQLSIAELYAIYRPSIGLVDQYVTPIWYAVGFPGNLLSFAVWTRPRMRPSSGCYLAALAAGDFLFLLMHLVFELQAAWDVPTLKAAIVCEMFPVLFLALQYLSPLLVLAFTVER
jgi:hypothetical protein